MKRLFLICLLVMAFTEATIAQIQFSPSLLNRAKAGNTQAQVELGLCYEQGLGVRQDYAQAVSWYHKAADQGNANAQYQLGTCYQTGRGVTQSWEMAAYYYNQACNTGHAMAAFQLGVLYHNEIIKDPSHTKAYALIKYAAEKGYATAQLRLGLFLASGDYGPINKPEARYWIEKAAAQGNEMAINMLQLLFE